MESGLVAGLTSAAISVLTGGLACIVGVGAIIAAFPELASYDGHTQVADLAAEAG